MLQQHILVPDTPDKPSFLLSLLCAQVGAPGNWDHIVNQIGMFSYTGLTKVSLGRLAQGVDCVVCSMFSSMCLCWRGRVRQ